MSRFSLLRGRHATDPREEEERQRVAQARKRQVLVRVVLEDFVREKLPRERKGADVARGLRA
jgi:hypothetical protein